MKGVFADFREQRSGNAAAAVLKIHGKVFDHIAAEGSGGGNFAAADGTIIRAADQKQGERFKGCIRPEDVQVRPAGEKGNNAIPGVVMVSTFLGRHNQLNVKTAIGEFVVSADQTQVFPVGTAVTLVLTENKIKLIG